MGPDLAVQKALRARLVATTAVTDLVPETAILDRNRAPAPRPSIVIGEAQVVDDSSDFARTRTRVYHTLHIWKTEQSREGVKRVAAAVRDAIRAGRLQLDDGYHCADLRISSIRTLADPDGETAHAVLIVEALVVEAAG